MAQGLYHYLGEAWKKPDVKTLRQRMITWRAGDAVVKVDKPLRLDRARSLGYKAKKGFIVVRVKLKRGGHKRPTRSKGRRTKRQAIRKNLRMNYQWIAEYRASNHYPSLEVLNSYKIGKDGIYYFFEVIMVDPTKPEILNDKTINWIAKPENKNRAIRGLTSSAKKSRGLRSKGPEQKIRPSRRAQGRIGN